MDWLSLEFLSGAQLVVALCFHFLFVPLALGLALLIAILQTKYYRSGEESYKRAARFWGRFLRISFNLALLTGLSLAFLVGTDRAGLAAYAGAVLGPLLLGGAGLAFFPGAALLTLWQRGWERPGKKLHLASIWLIVLVGSASAFWLSLANAWLQNPMPGSSFIEVEGAAELLSFGALFANPYGWGQFVHILSASWVLSGFFVLGVSALRLLFPQPNSEPEREPISEPKSEPEKAEERQMLRRSVRLAAPFTLAAVLGLGLSGQLQTTNLAEAQPAKLAALGAHWESGPRAPLYLLAWPDQENESNSLQALPLAGGLSFLARGSLQAEAPGLRDFPKDERPPLGLTILAFRLMLGLGFLFVLLSGLATLFRRSLGERRWLCRLLIFNLPLPYLALSAGWTLAEAGRLPWVIYGVMRSGDAASHLAAGPVGFSLAVFFLLYAALGLAAFYLMFRTAAPGLASSRPNGEGRETGNQSQAGAA